jgi:aryl-alcohol dehydrogenase-like predicted oxidoreductase
MEKRLFGNTCMNVSVLGFGGAEIGFNMTDVGEVERLLGSALDAGLNVIDTAECYNISEELIGRTVSHRRDEYYLFSKCGHASGFDLPDWDPKLLEQSIERSLFRMQTDYIDCVYLHTCSEEMLRRGEVIEVLQRAKERGLTRSIGYSGDHKAALYAVQCGAFDSLETSLSIADQEAIELTIPEAAKRGMGIVIKRPIANVVWKNSSRPTDPYTPVYWDRIQKLDYDFLKSDVKDSVATAINFTLSVPGVHTAIVGTTKPERWAENAKLLDQGLSEELYQAIRARWKAVAEPDWIGNA